MWCCAVSDAETVCYPSVEEIGKLPVRMVIEEEVPSLQWEESLDVGGVWVWPVPLEVQEAVNVGVAIACDASNKGGYVKYVGVS